MKYIGGVFVFLLGIMAQWMWSTYFSFFELAPQVLLVLTVAVASRSGPVAGQCFGFAWGLFLDLMSVHVFGAHALTLTLVGYSVGGLRRQMDVASLAPQFVIVFLVTPAYLLFYGFLGFVFEHHFLWSGWKILSLNPVINCLLAPFAFGFVKRTVDL